MARLTATGVLALVAGCGGSSVGGGGGRMDGSTAGGSVSAGTLRDSTSAWSGDGDVSVGQDSDGGVVTMRIGRQLTVTLASGWTPPRAQTWVSDAGATLQPLRLDHATGLPAAGVATATFTAVRVGQGLVTASTDAGSFQVVVQVLPREGTSAGPLPVPPS